MSLICIFLVTDNIDHILMFIDHGLCFPWWSYFLSWIARWFIVCVCECERAHGAMYATLYYFIGNIYWKQLSSSYDSPKAVIW